MKAKRTLSLAHRFACVLGLLPLISGLSGCVHVVVIHEGPSPHSDSGVNLAAKLDGPILDLWDRPLEPPPASEAALANLEQARAEWEAEPERVESWIWLGRRLAYLGRYGEAIAVYSDALRRFPNEPRLLRHRGHRWISVRRFDRAVEDLSLAAQWIEGQPDRVEPDGLPNAQNIPLSTLHTNVWYHLGLAHYLLGDWEAAREAYERCRKAGSNDDNWVSATHWLYMIHRKLGNERAAHRALVGISPDMQIIENMGYHRLCLFYKGELSASEALGASNDSPASDAVRYGIANWHAANGSVVTAEGLLQELVRDGNWASFGSLAAEADLHRLGVEPLAPRRAQRGSQ